MSHKSIHNILPLTSNCLSYLMRILILVSTSIWTNHKLNSPKQLHVSNFPSNSFFYLQHITCKTKLIFDFFSILNEHMQTLFLSFSRKYHTNTNPFFFLFTVETQEGVKEEYLGLSGILGLGIDQGLLFEETQGYRVVFLSPFVSCSTPFSLEFTSKTSYSFSFLRIHFNIELNTPFSTYCRSHKGASKGQGRCFKTLGVTLGCSWSWISISSSVFPFIRIPS